MGAWPSNELPSDLQHAQNRFRAWRQRRQRGERIPQELWTLAVRLVPSHGISRTAMALGLDYYGLKRRTEEAADQPQRSSPAFVELPTSLAVGKQALFELDQGAGISKRMQ